MGFEPTISAGERPQIYALDRATTGTGLNSIYTGYKSPPPLKICNLDEAKVTNLFNAASIYVIHHINKFLNNTFEGLDSLVHSPLLRQLESFLLLPLGLCMTQPSLFLTPFHCHKLRGSFYYVNRNSYSGHFNP